MMAEQDENLSHKIEGNPFDLAAIVADRIELDSILLLESHSWRNPNLELPDTLPEFEFGIDQTAHGKSIEDKKIYVKIGFVSRDVNHSTGEPSVYSVRATFVLVYNIELLDGVEDQNIWAFSVTTGIYNAWPYWREFLHNTTTRMGLPPIIAPPFRFTPKDSPEDR